MKVRFCALGLAALLMSSAAEAGKVASVTVTPSNQLPASAVLLGARPMALPRPAGKIDTKAAARAPSGLPARQAASPRQRQGNVGGPAQAPIQIVPDSGITLRAGQIAPRAASNDGAQFSTSRVELTDKASLSALYPYRASGRLAFRYKGANAWCSATLIDKGLVLTAAHCVAEFGVGMIPNAGWTFVPGYYKGKGAYGAITAQAAYALDSYVKGTETCADKVVCPNDVALLVLRPGKKKRYVGSVTGWLGIGVNDYGFTNFFSDGPFAAQVGQLGFPGGIDNGGQMIRNDAVSIARYMPWNGGKVPYNELPSPMDGGSSGGPWVLNLGISPSYTDVARPDWSLPNIIIGVTSWGYDDPGISLMGASPLTSDNLDVLIAAACKAYPDACTK